MIMSSIFKGVDTSTIYIFCIIMCFDDSAGTVKSISLI